MSEALPMPNDGCSCTPHVQDAGGGHFEHLLEYEPACPEHSEHLWNPRQGMWVDRAAHDAAVAAKAWDEGYAVGEANFIHSDYCGTRGCQCQGLHGTINPYLTKEAESDE